MGGGLQNQNGELLILTGALAKGEKREKIWAAVDFFTYRNCFRVFTASPQMGTAAAQTGRTATLLNRPQHQYLAFAKGALLG
jgi:hypothetical protein